MPAMFVLDPAARGGHATLLHAAARFGRLACARLLLDHSSTSTAKFLEMKDRGGFTPLLTAAWCGHLKLVTELISRGALLTHVGVPPMTSSCGGKGPYDALTWAERKQFSAVADVIREALHR